MTKAACLSAILNIVLNLILIPYTGYNGAAFTTLLSEAITAIIYMKNSKQFIDKIVDKTDLISIIFGCGGILFVCEIFDKLRLSEDYTIVLSVLFSCIFYFTIQLILKNKIVMNSLNSVKRIHKC